MTRMSGRRFDGEIDAMRNTSPSAQNRLLHTASQAGVAPLLSSALRTTPLTEPEQLRYALLAHVGQDRVVVTSPLDGRPEPARPDSPPQPAWSASGAALTALLRAAAVRLSAAGVPVWAVCPATGRLVSERPAEGPVVARWWWDRPYRIGCLTGEWCDAVEVPAWLGRRVLPVVAHAATVWEVGAGRERTWWFLVTAGSPVVFEFRHLVPGSWLHTDGALLLLPPVPGRFCRWVARRPGPGMRVRLPHSLCVQWAAINAARAARSEGIG